MTIKRTIYFLFVLLGCSTVSQEPIEIINAEKLISLKGRGVTVIDIRTPNEYENGHIPGVIHLDFMQSGFLDKIKEQKLNEPVIIHCASGGRSGKAAKMMKEAGFKKIYDYSGGFSDWKKKGLEIEQ
ncbi:rhodanese-like domain-containing protein [Ekhidna sp.]|uniref:rhodanese-like domain-containing protein n=1 Tax=Ekhidna sp. TaxID=2608089 RepID=UPI0032ECA65D